MNFQGRAQDKFRTLLYGFLILNLGSGFNQEDKLNTFLYHLFYLIYKMRTTDSP